ncbi:MAG: hypothetical protein K1Y01_00505 [Vicinamibacteria bacterium]|nr:hypothetical protein [Vicinamibacteria bacterium]
MPSPTADWSSNLERISSFLKSIGVEVTEGPVAPSALLPGVDIVNGGIVYDPDRLTWPGDLLHEAGHIAVVPAVLRRDLGGKLGEDVMAAHAGEAEATAWAWAAVVAIGLDPAVLFHEGGYQGRSQGLAFSYSIGSYPGAGGLIANGMALSASDAAKQGLAPYPHLVRWLRE